VIDRRDVLVASATALATSLMIPAMPAFAQATTVPGSKRGFLDRPGCRIYYEVTGSGPPIVFSLQAVDNHARRAPMWQRRLAQHARLSRR
jgi:hypothetical protein